MQIKQIRGNTWCLDGDQLIPFYRIDERQCILLDTGLYAVHEEIEQIFEEYDIVPAGIIATHAHTDHAGSLFYFQKKYNIPVALPVGEAGLCATMLDLKANFYVFPLHECEEAEDICHMEGQVDLYIGSEERACNLLGVSFHIYHLPGHSADHIAIGTPDGVVYVGDAILGGADLEQARLPYYMAIKPALLSMIALKEIPGTSYICAHKGIYTDIADVIDQNIQLLSGICNHLKAMMKHPMTLGEFQQMVYEEYHLLSGNLRKAELYERCVRSYIEYLVDTEQIKMYARRGMIWYQPIEQE